MHKMLGSVPRNAPSPQNRRPEPLGLSCWFLAAAWVKCQYLWEAVLFFQNYKQLRSFYLSLVFLHFFSTCPLPGPLESGRRQVMAPLCHSVVRVPGTGLDTYPQELPVGQEVE